MKYIHALPNTENKTPYIVGESQHVIKADKGMGKLQEAELRRAHDAA